MAITHLGPVPVKTNGELPAVGTAAPDFVLVGNNLNDIALKDFRGKNVVLNIFPSIDTSTCAQSVREFNRRAAALSQTVVLCISKDLPFAMRRFCGAEGIDRVVTVSDFRAKEFGEKYGLVMMEGAMRGLFARVVIVLDPHGVVKYSEVVNMIGDEPNYDAALRAI